MLQEHADARCSAQKRAHPGTDDDDVTERAAAEINVSTRQQVHEKLAKGGWGELCAEFLRERGVPLLPVPLLERQHLLAQDVAGAADDQPLMADAKLLVARAPFAAHRNEDVADEQTERIRENIYHVEDFPAMATTEGLRRTLNEQQARASAGQQAAQAGETHHHYHFAQQMETWVYQPSAEGTTMAVVINPTPSLEFAHAARLNGWFQFSTCVTSTAAEIGEVTRHVLERGERTTAAAAAAARGAVDAAAAARVAPPAAADAAPHWSE